MGETIAVDRSGSPPITQIIFSAIGKQKERDWLFLPRKEGAYRTQRPSALESPLPLYTNQTFKRVVLFKATTATSACASPGLKNSPLYIQSLPEHCLSLKTIVTIFLSKRAFKTELAPCIKSPQEGPHPTKKKKRKRKKNRKKKRKIFVIKRTLQMQNVSLEAK